MYWGMYEIPLGFLVFSGIMLPVTAVLLWSIRDDFRTRGGRFDAIRLIENAIGLYLLTAMVCAAGMQVLVRYIGGEFDFPWTEELGRLLLVWTAFWGAAVIQRSGDHIAVSILFDRLPAAARRIGMVLIQLVTVAAMAPVVWYGWQTAQSLNIMATPSLNLPLSAFAYPVPVGGALFIVHTLFLAWRYATGQRVDSEAEGEQEAAV
ncbi:TRAP-type C4-dicarboxylate transport system permease small subunit [Constrictibacter sp. MBR-5]|jgi:TRAP-type C4-dicarboxylate transport system permease small subunit|uniref:TRAP transporter small permease n=1 Tax=Constrictibacter sp. MBR-5 TaxID=3156467 RepID=UPI003396C981